jgi:hypothetical protein
MSVVQLKSMADKAKDSVNLMKQIRDLGILESDPSYLEVKTYLNEWIKSEDKLIKNYEIYFSRYGRDAKLTLPWRSDRTCEFSMKKSVAY